MVITLSEESNGRIKIYCPHPRFPRDFRGSVASKDLFRTMWDISNYLNNVLNEEAIFETE